MATRRKVPSTRQSRRMSESMRQSTIGSHVDRSSGSAHAASRPSARTARRASHSQVGAIAPATSSGESKAAHRQRTSQRQYVEAVQHRARRRNVVLVIVVALAVVAIAVGAGLLAFRGSVGSEMSLRDSDASQALVAVRADEPYYALIAVELGSVAKPLSHAGPDVLLLARVDRAAKSLSLVGIPSGLRVSSDGGVTRVADLAEKGDAALIGAISTFAKIDISHYVKVGEGGLQGIVDALGGLDVNITQVIDDPHAGDVYLPVGEYALNGTAALTYLRADNLRLGTMDQLQNQVDFAATLLSKLFAGEGSFGTRIDSIDAYFQTDLSFGDIEGLQSVFRDITPSDIARTVLPGYLTEVTGVVDTGDALYIGSADDMADIIASLEAGQAPDVSSSSGVQAADPASFTIEVQNGTSITGAAGVTAETLTSAGFDVVKTGNAEQPVYEETLVVYKGDEGPARAKAVIDAIGTGRAISGDIYYSFEPDVLVIIGSDYKPFV